MSRIWLTVKTSTLHVTDLCAGNSPVTGEFPAQGASNAEIVSIWWRHQEVRNTLSPHIHIFHFTVANPLIVQPEPFFLTRINFNTSMDK